MARKDFKNLTLDLSKIASLTASEKLNMLQTDNGRELLSSLTPEQLASMFPDYYLKRLPDVGVNLPGIRDLKALSRGAADKFMGEESARVRGGERYRPQGRMEIVRPAYTPEWMKKLEDQTGMKMSDEKAKVELSQEKRNILEEMEKSGIKAGDPRLNFLKDKSDEFLKSVGITKQTDSEGNIIYRREDISEAEVKAKMETLDPSVELIRKTILGKESSGRYDITSFAEGKGSTASGGYQFSDRTWKAQAAKAGVDPSLYPRAKDAPPELQDKVARSYIKDILARNGGDISAVPREWYAGPKGYLTENELKVNKGMTADQYVSDWMSRYKTNAKAAGEPISEVQLAKNFEDTKKEIRGNQNRILAEATEVPDLPQGLDPKIAELFNRSSPRKKQDLVAMIKKAGEGGGSTEEQMANGVAKVNELYKLYPKQVEVGIFSGNGQLLFSNQSVRERSAQLAPATVDALTKLEQMAPPGTTITSTYRSPQHEIERRKRTPGAHTRGAAVDIRTEGKTEAELAETIKALKRAGFTKVLLEGNPPHIHAEVNPGQEFQISNLGQGDPNIRLEVAQDAARQVVFNEPLPTQQADARNPEPITEATRREQAPPPPQARPESAQASPQQVSEATQESRPTQSVTVEPQQEPAIAVMADGGKMRVGDGEIKAVPIQATKGDNSVVVDDKSNPLFTMNTKEEKASYDPKTRQVSIEPVNKTNPSDLEAQPSYGENVAANNEPMEAAKNGTKMKQEPMSQQPYRSSMDVSMAMAASVFKDPSFERAIARTRFVDSGDAALGGHFGLAQADIA